MFQTIAHITLVVRDYDEASNQEEASRIGNQTGGRVFLFLHTDNFWRDYNTMREKGVKFITGPEQNEYGTVAVFEDLYGNKWDLPQPGRNQDQRKAGG